MHGAWIGSLGRVNTIVGVAPSFDALDLKRDPRGAYPLLGAPLSELAGACAAREDVFGTRTADELVERVREAPRWDACFGRAERF